MSNSDKFDLPDSSIAVIGMAGRFPGANSVDELWQNLHGGIETISSFSEQELKDSGVISDWLSNPKYIKRKGILSGVELFDASFFGMNPREAAMTDPQHRIFLECVWQALENAGYDAETYEDRIGIYGGAGASAYAINMYFNPDYEGLLGGMQSVMGNALDHLTTKVSYKLNLRGPSIDLQCSCSTSLVAVHLACQSLLNGECSMALAGGVSITLPQKGGYFYEEGGILSPDGHCRAFDAKAQGTVGGNGAGVVVLRRLAEAIEDGDNILAVIRGSAINNDGSMKVGYMAPSVDGQAEVIAEALAVAEVEPESISYVETHGTGTVMGDPIEIAALTKAFRKGTRRKEFCAIGSVKTNVGHLDAAAGVTGLIKTVLSLEHKLLPASLHFEQPNPAIDFAESPFYVNADLREWTTNGTPRRACVSSFGIGGTNAHLIVEEAPEPETDNEARPHQLIVLSAKTASALEAMSSNLALHLDDHHEMNLADLAYTLQVGRRDFSHRQVMVCQTIEDAVSGLRTLDPERIFTSFQEYRKRPVVFMFPGQGAQYVNMGKELYQTERVYREAIDQCCELLAPLIGLDLRDVMYPSEDRAEEAKQKLDSTYITQPALFVTEYALARLWMEWGIRPQTMIGHSIGEYVAACIAGVFSLKDALKLVAARGRLMQQIPKGAMLSVSLSEEETSLLLGDQLSLAAVNGPSLCVVSGHEEDVSRLQQLLTQRGVSHRRLITSHAFHSSMMDSILEPFIEEVKRVTINPPKLTYFSCLTGAIVTADDVLNPEYWARHLRFAVRFADAIEVILTEPHWLLLEVGPGNTLSTFARQHTGKSPATVVLSSLRHPHDQNSDSAFLINTLGRLWLAGAHIDWKKFHNDNQRRRVPIPTYPFERQRYWIDPVINTNSNKDAQTTMRKKSDVRSWLYLPTWKQSLLPALLQEHDSSDQNFWWLVFADRCDIGHQIAQRLEQAGHQIIIINRGDEFKNTDDHVYTIDPRRPESYDALIGELRRRNQIPKGILHFWNVTPDEHSPSEINLDEDHFDSGFYSLLFLTQALASNAITDSIQIDVISTNMQDVTGEEALCSEKSALLGPCKVISQEYPNLICRSIDITISAGATLQKERLLSHLTAEFLTRPKEKVVAYRGGHRWVQTYEPIRLSESATGKSQLKEKGVYLITGGLGQIGLVFAEYLAKRLKARIVLAGRSAFPAKDAWEQWLADHDEHDDISYKIRKLQQFEETGAQILVASADVTDEVQMRTLIQTTLAHFGELHGVIHAAKTFHKGIGAIQEIDRAECEAYFSPKVQGLAILQRVLHGMKLDFVLLMSTMSSVLGGLGLSAISAANLFMDGFAHKQRQINPVPWMSVDWDFWRFEESDQQSHAHGTTFAELGITPEEGVEILDTIMTSQSPAHFVVSTGDLQARIDQWINLDSMRKVEEANKTDSAVRHPRPDLPNAFVAARNDLERTIAVIWQDMFGISQIGVHDNFFDLGGHSLLATQIVSRLRESFQIELPLRSLLEKPTIAGLGKIIEEILVKEIEGLTEKEAEALLE